MEYRVSYSFSKQNWKKIFYDPLRLSLWLPPPLLCCTTVVTASDTVFSLFLLPAFIAAFFRFATRKSQPSIQFYDRKKWLFDVCAIEAMAMEKSFFRSTANVVSMIVVVADFIVLISIVNTITRRLLLLLLLLLCFFCGSVIDLCRSIFIFPHFAFCWTSCQAFDLGDSIAYNEPCAFVECAISIFEVKNTRITCLCQH